MNTIDEHKKANQLKWNIRAKTYDEKRYDYFRHMQKEAVSIINMQENDHFLDLGCGTGWAVKYVAEILHQKGSFIGIDISEEMIRKAKERTSGTQNVDFYNASSDDLPLNDDYFDHILCTNSFHHYMQPVKVLTEVKRVLKPGARIYIVDLTADNFFIKLIDKVVRRKEREHVRFYSSREYKKMVSEAGLTYIKGTRLKWPFRMPLKVHVVEK